MTFAGIGVAVLVIALVLAGVASSGNVVLVGLLVMAIGVLLALGFPRGLFWAAVIGSLVIAGLLELYVPRLQAMRWIFGGAASLFLAAVVLKQFWHQAARRAPQPGLTWAMLLFAVMCIASLALNWHDSIVAVAGVKNYFQAWGLFFGMALMSRWDGFERTLPKLLLAIGLVQLPFALHQFFFIVPVREHLGGLTAVDVVAGTFGASVTGGGNNASMAMFVIVLTSVLVAIWRTGALRTRWLVLALPLLVPIFLNESKVSVVYLVLAFVLIFRREIAQRPLRVLLLSAVVSAVGFGLVLSYAALHKASRAQTPVELIEEVIRQNTHEGERYGKLKLNRTTSVSHWFKEQRNHPMSKTLLGHGLSESKLESGVLDISRNLSSNRYPGLGIGVTSVSALLWDVGLIGLACALAIFLSAFRLAGRLGRQHASSPYLAGLFQGLQAAVVILALSLLHKPFFTFQLGYQVLVAVVLGFLVYSWRNLSPARPCGHATVHAKRQSP